MVCGQLLPLLRRGRSYILNEPNSVGTFTNAKLLPTLLDSISSLRAIQVFNVWITHATSSHPLVLLMSFVAIISPTKTAFSWSWYDIRRHAMRLWTRHRAVKTSQMSLSGTAKESKPFPPSIMVGVPAV